MIKPIILGAGCFTTYQDTFSSKPYVSEKNGSNAFIVTVKHET